MKRKQFSSVWFSLLLLLGGCQDGQEQVNELQPVNVKTMTVVRGAPSDGSRYSGTVEEQNGTPLSFSVAGTAQAVHVRLGQRVAAGQLIATLDDASLRNSHAAAQAALEQAEDAYRRMKELHDKGSLPDIKWVEVQSQVEQARSVEQIAAKNLRDCRLYAPYDGVIAAKNVEVGQNVVPGLSVAQLVSTSVLNVRIAVPETEIASVAVGQSAYITVQALGNRSFKGTDVDVTAQVADSLEHILRQDPRVVSVASFKGCASPRFQTSYAPQIAGTNYAQFIVNTTGVEATEELLDEYTPEYTDYFPGARVRFKQLSYSDAVYPVEVRLSGEDLEAIKHDARKIEERLHGMDGLLLVQTDFNEPLPAVDIRLKEDEATRLGVTNLGLESTLGMRYGDGLAIANVWEVPLRQVADVVPAWKEGQIVQRNGIYTASVQADLARGENAMQMTARIREELKDFPLSPGVTLTYGGEQGKTDEQMPQIMGGLILAAAIIFFILLAHFRKISIALLIFGSLALCLFGTAFGVWIQGVEFGVTAILGVVSLMGIIVRNGIIMIDYAEELRATEHMTAEQAIYHSALRRMRPIFLTSAAASMGVIPMILGKSSLWMPMGTVICYGTLITMIFLLTVLPCMYLLTFRGSSKRRAKWDALEQQ